MSLSNAEQIGLILGGTVLAAIGAAVGAYIYDSRKSARKPLKRQGLPEPSARALQEWSKKLGIVFDPKDPHDPMAALIAAGEYFRLPGCEPGGPHYEETFQQVLLMMDEMVPADRLEFWREQVYRLYGTKYLLGQYKKK